MCFDVLLHECLVTQMMGRVGDLTIYQLKKPHLVLFSLSSFCNSNSSSEIKKKIRNDRFPLRIDIGSVLCAVALVPRINCKHVFFHAWVVVTSLWCSNLVTKHAVFSCTLWFWSFDNFNKANFSCCQLGWRFSWSNSRPRYEFKQVIVKSSVFYTLHNVGQAYIPFVSWIAYQGEY